MSLNFLLNRKVKLKILPSLILSSHKIMKTSNHQTKNFLKQKANILNQYVRVKMHPLLSHNTMTNILKINLLNLQAVSLSRYTKPRIYLQLEYSTILK